MLFCRWVAPFLVMQSEHILVLEDDDELVVGFVAAAPDARQLYRKVRMAWLDELRTKYPMPETPPERRTPAEVGAIGNSLKFANVDKRGQGRLIRSTAATRGLAYFGFLFLVSQECVNV